MGKRNNWQEFQVILEQHHIKKLYHFTDRKNLQSIINNGGLYSWADCEEKGITIAKPGGGEPSRKLDKKHGLEHYVRLSFTKRHPMMFVAKDDGRINDPVILEINPEILYEEYTLFSDKNAASNDAHVGGTLDDFKKIHFKSVKASKHFDLEESEQPYFQAEVLIKNFIPLKYITNIESFGIPIPVEPKKNESFKVKLFDEVELTTEVPNNGLANGLKDEFGAIYSEDGRRLLKGPNIPSYQIKPGTIDIDVGAFQDCGNLNSIAIPNSVITICSRSFQGCGNLSSIIIPNSVTRIGSDAFRGCKGLTNIIIPDSVTKLYSGAFYDCSGMTSLAVGESVIFIENNVFGKCSALNSIYVDSGNPRYDSRNNCNAIIETSNNTLIVGCKNTIIPDSVSSIGRYAFDSRCNLKSIDIPNSVTSIGDLAFIGCSGLTNIVIPDSVTTIGRCAFSGCSDLTKVVIPKSVTEIDNDFLGIFSGCYNLSSICVDSRNPRYDSRNNCNAIIETASNNLIAGCKNSIIPNTATSIDWRAFSSCSSLTSIDIPDSVSFIERFAFRDTKWYDDQPDGLVYAGTVAYKYKGNMPDETHITIKNGTKSISGSAFSHCNGLKSVIIPNSVRRIGNRAFDGCGSLSDIIIPDSVDYIGVLAFKGCTSLTNIVIPDSVSFIGSFAFRDTKWYDNQPDGLVYAGTVAYRYKGNMPDETHITIKNGTKSISGDAFSDCKGLKSVIIPNSVIRIGSSAFKGCSSLTNIVIPESISTIEEKPFFNCVNLNSIYVDSGNSKYDSRNNCNAIIKSESNTLITGCKNTIIPNSVTEIAVHAFMNCIGLVSVTIPNSVIRIGGEAFEGCCNLNSIYVDSGNPRYDSRNNCNAIIETSNNTLIVGCKNTIIPNSVTEIANSAFRNCKGLTSVTIPDSVIRIGSSAFMNCSDLNSVVIGNSVILVDDYSFEGCTELTTVTIKRPFITIGDLAFYGCNKITKILIPMGSRKKFLDAFGPKFSSKLIEVNSL